MENRIGFGKRFGAVLIDGILCGIIAFFGGAAIGGMLGAVAGAPTTSPATPMTSDQVSTMMGGAIAGAFMGFVAIALAYSLLEGFTGWTLGKLIVGIQIGSQDGTRASVGQLLMRWALKNSNGILTILAVFTGIALLKTVGTLAGLAIFVGFFFIFASSKQGFHDMIAKTAVYKRSQLNA